MNSTETSSVLTRYPELTVGRLEAFRAVVAAGGYTLAAGGDPTRMSQLHRQVKELSRALGVELMERRARAVVPTLAGRRLSAVLADLSAGLAEVATSGQAAPVALTLAAGDGVLQWLVLPRVGALLEAAPLVRLTVTATSNATDDVASGRADFGLTRDEAAPAGMTRRVVGRLGWTLFVPRRMGAATSSELGALLARLPLVRVTGDPAALDELASRLRVSVTPALSCETFPQAARAVASGRFAALLPSIAAVELTPAIATAVPVAVRGARPARLSLVARLRTVETRDAVAVLYRALASALGEALVG